jgi:hypothetical protein
VLGSRHCPAHCCSGKHAVDFLDHRSSVKSPVSLVLQLPTKQRTCAEEYHTSRPRGTFCDVQQVSGPVCYQSPTDTPASSSLARVAALHQKWIKCRPDGALSVECQELNALHSQSVDGGKIVIPERLSNPPETTEPFILDLLAEAAKAFSERFLESLPVYDVARDLPRDDAMQYIRQLLRGERRAFSEFEMFNMVVAIARKREIDLRPMLPYLNLGALTVQQKYTVSSTLKLSQEEDRYIWNSLFWSDILTERDLDQRKLNARIPLQRFYSSNKSGLRTFWQYLKMCLEDFTRKILVLKVKSQARTTHVTVWLKLVGL